MYVACIVFVYTSSACWPQSPGSPLVHSPGPQTPLFPITAVARRTGVPVVTIRAWERRYAFPRPTRGPGGRRLYTELDVATLRALRAQTAQGVPISRAIALLREAAPEPSTGSPPPPIARLRQQLLDALLALAPGRAEAVLSEALGLLSVEDVCLGVVQPVLNEIGRRWRAGQAAVTQEHFATALVRARLARLLQMALVDRAEPVILAACPPGEWHELGLLTVCVFLARRGHPVRYLGANLPGPELLRLASRAAPRLVILSAQTEASADQLAGVLRLLHELPEPRPVLAYGGSVFNDRPDLRDRTPGVFLGADAWAAVATVEQHLAPAPTPRVPRRPRLRPGTDPR